MRWLLLLCCLHALTAEERIDGAPSADTGNILGITVALADDGSGLRITTGSDLGRMLGLVPGMVLAAADGQRLTHLRDLDAAIIRGRRLGALSLELTDGTRCSLRLSIDQPAPQVAAVTRSGTLTATDGPARPELPLTTGVVLITSRLEPALRLRIRGSEPPDHTPLEAMRTTFVDLAEPVPFTVEIDRRGVDGGAWLLTAHPLHLQVLSEHIQGDTGWASRITVPTLAGEPLWIEAGCQAPIELNGTDAAGNALVADRLPALPGMPYRLVIRCVGNPPQLPLQTLRSGGLATALAHTLDAVDGDIAWRVGLDRPWAWLKPKR